jgi:ABC-type dipeptide/oligopeptide/nickel transport system permease component
VISYIRDRLLAAIPVIIGVSIFTFMIVRLLPGDPVLVMLGGPEANASPQQIAQLRQDLGLDDSILVQYGKFVGNILQGNLGRSIRSNRPVIQEIAYQAPATIQLACASMALAVVFGVAFGVIAACYERSWIDRAFMLLSLIGVSMPSFWLGLLLIFTFAIRLAWVPVVGQGGLDSLILPAITLASRALAVIALLTRTNMREVLNQEYVTTARSKGLSEMIVMSRHALKNSLIPVITVVGLQFGALLGGAVVVENVFARQGLGRLVVEAIGNRDFPVVQGIVLITATTYVVINIIVDLSYAVLDPRIHYE